MTRPEPPHRVAVYFAPDPQHAAGRAWWAAGCQWLGRDAATGQACAQTQVPGLAPAVFAALTAEPRRYGWHATLKAPFHLAEGVDLPALDAAVAALAQSLCAFDMPPLAVADMGHFLALRPTRPSDPMQALASACVTQLHALAKPLDAEALARRLRSPLSPNQTELLHRWGYPWVLDEFRLHCSLTGDLRGTPPTQRHAIEQAARAHFAALPPPRVCSLAVFVEPQVGADFLLHRHWPLGLEGHT